LKEALKAPQVTNWSLLKHSLRLKQKDVTESVESVPILKFALLESEKQKGSLVKLFEQAEFELRLAEGQVATATKSAEEANARAAEMDKKSTQIALLKSQLSIAKSALDTHQQRENTKIEAERSLREAFNKQTNKGPTFGM
jgi:transcription initiation factor IIF auxiliary subunit